MLLSERIAEDGITVTADMIGQTETHYQWAVTLHRPNGAVFRLPDPFESNTEPTAFDVLDLLTGALNIVDQSVDRREWASEYTTDPEQQDAHFTEQHWQTWQQINAGLRRFWGRQRHEDYLYDTDCQG